MKKTQNEAIEKVNNKAIQRESIELTANILKRASEITDQTMQVMRPPLIRLDHSGALTGKIGEWAIEDSKDKEGKPVYAPLGAEFAAHILKIRILLKSQILESFFSQTKRCNSSSSVSSYPCHQRPDKKRHVAYKLVGASFRKSEID